MRDANSQSAPVVVGRRGAIGLFALLSAAPFLGGCTPEAADEGSGSARSSGSTRQESPARETSQQMAARQFSAALSAPDVYFPQVDSGLLEGATYSYAFVDVYGPDVPVMLLKAGGPMDTWGGVDSVRVLGFNEDGDEAIAYEGELSEGVASAGGYRGALSASSSGAGLIYEEFSSGTGEMTSYHIGIEGTSLAKTVAHCGIFGDESPCAALLSSDMQDIVWADVGDTALLDELAGRGDEPTDFPDVDWQAKAVENGLVACTGTIRVLDADGLLALQEMTNPNSGYEGDETYVVLSLDAVQALTARGGDGSIVRDGQASLISLEPTLSSSGFPSEWYPDGWATLDGRRVTVVVNPDRMWWPSDTGLPLGEPRCQDFLIIA